MSENVKENITAAPLSPISLKPAESSRNVWRVTAALGTQRKDFQNPNYWAHVSNKLKPNDLIEAIAEDGSFYATFIVRNCDRTWARVCELDYTDLNPAPLSKEELSKIRDEYDIKLRGPKGWCVIRRQTNNVMHEGCHSREDAEDWLKKFLESQRVAA